MDATGRTIAVVNTVWALVIGTLLIGWAKNDLYPHLVADGSLEGDYPALLGAFAIGVVLAAPSVFKSRAVNLMEAIKGWRAAKGGDG